MDGAESCKCRVLSPDNRIQLNVKLPPQSVLTGRDEHGDGAGLSVGGAAGVVPAVGRLHRGDHQSAARLPAVLP